MDMPVNEIARPIFVQQVPETLKTGMGKVFSVIELLGGRVG